MYIPPPEKAEAFRNLKISVPRDPDVVLPEREERTPAPNFANLRDEDSAAANKPLPADSPVTQSLNEHQPHAPGQLDVGTAGDPARPDKEGIHDKPIPPSGEV